MITNNIMKSITMRRKTKSKVIMKNIMIMNTTKPQQLPLPNTKKEKVKFMMRNSSIIKKDQHQGSKRHCHN